MIMQARFFLWKRRVVPVILVLLAGFSAGWKWFVIVPENSSPHVPVPMERILEKTTETRNDADDLVRELATALAHGDEVETEAALAEISAHLETHPEDFSRLTSGLAAHLEIRRQLPELLRLTGQAGRYPVCAAALQVVRQETVGKDGRSRTEILSPPVTVLSPK